MTPPKSNSSSRVFIHEANVKRQVYEKCTCNPQSDTDGGKWLLVQSERVLDWLLALLTLAVQRALLPLGRTLVAGHMSAGECDVLWAVHAD